MTKPGAAGVLMEQEPSTSAGVVWNRSGGDGGQTLQTLFCFIWVESLGELEDFKLYVYVT